MNIKEKIRAAKYAEKITALSGREKELLMRADDFEISSLRESVSKARVHGVLDREMEIGIQTQIEIIRTAWKMVLKAMTATNLV